jgi:hypothetical protein
MGLAVFLALVGGRYQSRDKACRGLYRFFDENP